jgi:hypothetical protein
MRTARTALIVAILSWFASGPVAVHRHANTNLTDIKISKEFGLDFGGNAAFADYLITASVSVMF